jgi:hypothetical protein
MADKYLSHCFSPASNISVSMRHERPAGRNLSCVWRHGQVEWPVHHDLLAFRLENADQGQRDCHTDDVVRAAKWLFRFWSALERVMAWEIAVVSVP